MSICCDVNFLDQGKYQNQKIDRENRASPSMTQPPELAPAIGNCRSKCRGKQHFPRQKNCQGNICTVEKFFLQF